MLPTSQPTSLNERNNVSCRTERRRFHLPRFFRPPDHVNVIESPAKQRNRYRGEKMIKTVHEDDLEAWYRLTELEPGRHISIADFELEDEDLLVEVFSK
jgi:hypothetical protein